MLKISVMCPFQAEENEAHIKHIQKLCNYQYVYHSHFRTATVQQKIAYVNRLAASDPEQLPKPSVWSANHARNLMVAVQMAEKLPDLVDKELDQIIDERRKKLQKECQFPETEEDRRMSEILLSRQEDPDICALMKGYEDGEHDGELLQGVEALPQTLKTLLETKRKAVEAAGEKRIKADQIRAALKKANEEKSKEVEEKADDIEDELAPSASDLGVATWLAKQEKWLLEQKPPVRLVTNFESRDTDSYVRKQLDKAPTHDSAAILFAELVDAKRHNEDVGKAEPTHYEAFNRQLHELAACYDEIASEEKATPLY